MGISIWFTRADTGALKSAKTTKREFVKQFNSVLKDKEFVLVADYKGLNAAQISNLREQIAANNSNFKVAKNTLARRAIKGTNFEILEKLFVGPTSLAYSDDPVSTSKVLVDFAKDNDSLKILGGAMGDKELSVEEINKLASLPSLEVLRGKIVGLLFSTTNQSCLCTKRSQSGLARLIKTKYQEKGEQTMADIQKIADDLSNLTVLEASELTKILEDKWGVSAAACKGSRCPLALKREATVLQLKKRQNLKYI